MLKNLTKFSTAGLLLAGLLVAGLIGCKQEGAVKKISFEKKEALKIKEVLPENKRIRIAVGGMITPKEGFAYYRRLLDYIGEKLKMPVKFVDREDYAEINQLLSSGNIDVAFVCGGPYAQGHDEFGMELLVAPQAYGKTVYYSYIIVHAGSPIKSFEELRGKTFAFADPLSNSGKLVPTYMLSKMGETPETYFKKYIYTHAHDKSIKAVAQKIVDGAAVDSLIWEYANRVNPEFTSKTKIIEKSLPYGIPPVVVRPGLDPELKERLRQIFLNIHEEEKGREILKGIMIDKFVIIDDSAYDSIRQMKVWIDRQKQEK